MRASCPAPLSPAPGLSPLITEPVTSLLWIRHPQVDLRYRGVCYGRSDVPLGPEGQRQSSQLVEQLQHLPIRRIVHSGLQRTKLLATALAERVGCTAECEVAIAERDFGRWELQSWDDIYRREGDEMLKMVSEPERFRPGGGETTFELADRVWSWYRELRIDGLTVVLTHGGPIAACLGRQRQLGVSDWLQLVPACGTLLWIEPWKPADGSRFG